jgi:hypothetical protein
VAEASLVWAIACGACYRLSPIGWYGGVPVVRPTCECCGVRWSQATLDQLAAQLPHKREGVPDAVP